MLKIAESQKTLKFLMFFNDFRGSRDQKIEKNLKKNTPKTNPKQSIDSEPLFSQFLAILEPKSRPIGSQNPSKIKKKTEKNTSKN